MTRSESRREQEILQKSADAASSSVGPASSNWSRNGLIGDEAQIGYAETPSRVAQDEMATSKTTADSALARREGLNSTESKELAKELGLDPTSDHAMGKSVDSQIANFFSSSPEKSSTASPEKASQVIESPSVRPGGNAQMHTKRFNIPEVVIDAATSSKDQISASSRSVVDEPRSETATKKKKSEASTSRPKSVASTAASAIESEVSTPSKRPRRNAAKAAKYTCDWNKDGTEKKKKGGAAEKAGKGKASSRVSSAASKKGKQHEVIELSSDEEEEEESSSDEDQTSPVPQRTLTRQATRAASPERDSTQDGDESTQTGDGTTLVDEDTIDKSQEGDNEDDDDDKALSIPRKGKGSSKTETNTVVSDGEGLADDSDDELLTMRKRGRPSSSGSKQKDNKRVKRIRDDEDEEDEVEAHTSSMKANKMNVEDKEGDEIAEAEEETSTKKGRSAALKDASAKVNAKPSQKAKETTNGKRKREEESQTPSTGASSTSNSILSSKENMRFWGKPLKTLRGFTRPRVAGLVKKSIAPLLTIRSEPPTRREAIPQKKKKPKKGDVVLDSDEERELEEQRANETAEQRMARLIRECEDEEGGY